MSLYFVLSRKKNCHLCCIQRVDFFFPLIQDNEVFILNGDCYFGFVKSWRSRT